MRRLTKVWVALIIGTLPLTICAIVPEGLLRGALTASAAGPFAQAGQGDRQEDRRKQEFFNKRTFQGKPIPPNAYDQAAEQWKRIPRAGGTLRKGVEEPKTLALSSLSGTVWVPIGPSPLQQGTDQVNGRPHAIAVNPNNPNVIYQGADIGGVWRTIDAGAHWTPLFDQQPALGIGQPGAIAIDPNDTNTIYVGTSARFQLSKGIIKSTDGGGSWIVLGSGFPAGNNGNSLTLFQGQNVNRIIVEPSNSNILYLVASNGLYRSTNAGQNWTQGTNGGGGAAFIPANTLSLDTTSPTGSRILYAGINGSGIRQSTDGGQSWTQILNTATPAISAALPPGGGIGKVVVALAPSTAIPNPAGIQVIYAAIQGTGGAPDPLGVFESTDQGGTWTQRPATGLGSCQCGFTMQMSVDPASPGDGANDILLWGGTNQVRSTDSGANFTDISNGQHVDTRAEWVFVPQPAPTPSIIYTGNDGGIYRSTDNGAHWTGTGLPGAPATINAGGLQTTLFYHMDLKRDATASVTLGSLQDNGSVQTTGIPLWTARTGGDGFDVVFDRVSLDDAFEIHNISATTDGVFKSMDSGTSFAALAAAGIPANELGIFGNSVNIDPSNAGFVYVSGSASSVFQSTDGGATFRNIGNLGGGIGEVDVAPANSNNVVAVSGSQVFVSTNALAAMGVTFTNITRNLPARAVATVAFDPNDPTVIFALLSGFDSQTPGQPGHVFRTTIGGSTWTDISPPLDVPFTSIALDGTPAPTAIYAGNDLGVMRSVDNGASWTVLDDVHFPNIPVTDLKINQQAGVLRASTFGRGVFEFAAPNGPVIAINAENGLDFGGVCTGTPTNLTIQIFNVGTQNLIINSVQRLFGSTGFTVLPNPATPLIISPNAEVDFTVRFTPTVSSGSESAQIRISSNDPAAPAFDLFATATVGTPAIDTLIADNGNFGNVCVGSFKDLPLTINNSGSCNLVITNIASSSGQFQVAGVMSFPLVIAPGGNVQVPIRFQPTSLGAKSANITISSNDPTTPSKVVAVSGNAPPGDIRVTGSTDFGDVCAGVLAEKTVSVCNVGACDLHVISATINCPDFTIINNPFPATVSHDSCLSLVIRFTPTSAGPKTCTLTITSDDPDTPIVMLTLTANTPFASIDVPPDVSFPPTVIQSVGPCTSLKPFPISNTGTCNLKITSISIGGPNGSEFSLVGLPSFPIILEPGHIVGEGNLKIAFAPTAIDRDRFGTITVTYESDPVTQATMNVVRNLCGEGVRTGARVLVTVDGVPIAMVEKIQLQRITGNRNKPILDTVDVARNLPLVAVTPGVPCVGFQYHREYGTVSNPIQLLPGSYQVTVTAIVNGRRRNKSIGFDVSTCTFNPTIVVGF